MDAQYLEQIDLFSKLVASCQYLWIGSISYEMLEENSPCLATLTFLARGRLLFLNYLSVLEGEDTPIIGGTYSEIVWECLFLSETHAKHNTFSNSNLVFCTV